MCDCFPCCCRCLTVSKIALLLRFYHRLPLLRPSLKGCALTSTYFILCHGSLSCDLQCASGALYCAMCYAQFHASYVPLSRTLQCPAMYIVCRTACILNRAMCNAPLVSYIMQNLSCRVQCVSCQVFFILHPSSCGVQCTSWVVLPALCFLHRAMRILCCISCILCHAGCNAHILSYFLHRVSCGVQCASFASCVVHRAMRIFCRTS